MNGDYKFFNNLLLFLGQEHDDDYSMFIRVMGILYFIMMKFIFMC